MTSYQQGQWPQPALRDLVLARLQRGHEARLQVVGWSMAPLLHPGDWVRVQRADARQVRRGDVVVVWHNGAFLTHRVLRAGADAWLLRGDQSLTCDPPLTAQALVGKVVGRERGTTWLTIDTTLWRGVCGLAGALAYAAPRWSRLATRLLLAAALLHSKPHGRPPPYERP